MANFIRQDLALDVRNAVGAGFKVDASPGKGNWAETPWAAVFEPSVTTSATRGIYLVYLFRNDGKSVYLALNQGTTEVFEAVGASRYLDVLADRATVDVQLLDPKAVEGLRRSRLDLPGSLHLSRGYNAGNIVATEYLAEDLPSSASLEADLDRFISLYIALIDARESINESTSEDLPDGISTGEEARKFRWHRRTERNPKLAKQAKQFHGETCRVCGFNFEAKYGDHGAGYIEAHHLVPLAELAARPGPVVLDPRTDFTVVCANCHRMLHRNPAPSVQELRGLLGPHPAQEAMDLGGEASTGGEATPRS